MHPLPPYMQDHPVLWFIFNGEPAPFSNPGTYWVDGIRVVCIIVGTLLAGTCISEMRNSGKANPIRTYAMLAMCLFAVVSVITETGRLGNVISLRLPLVLTANIFGVMTMRLLHYRIGGRRVFPPDLGLVYEGDNNNEENNIAVEESHSGGSARNA